MNKNILNHEKSGFSLNKRKAGLVSLWMFCLIMPVCGLIAGSFFDWSIDEALFNPKTQWAILFGYIGPLPVYINLMTSVWLLIDGFYGKSHKNTQTTRMVLWKNIWRILGMSAVILTIDLTQFELNHSHFAPMVWITFFLSLLGAMICHKAFRSFSPVEKIQAAFFIVLTSCIGMILVSMIKHIWQRPRFIALEQLNPSAGKADYSAFKNWWQISSTPLPPALEALKIKDPDLFYSFVSGHTCSASMSFAMLIVILHNSKAWKHRCQLTALCLFWTMATGLSRMILGKHFLSDISGGMIVGLVSMMILLHLLYSESFNSWLRRQKIFQ